MREILIPFFILQKRIIRIIKSLPFRTHTSPYFEGLNILNIFQLCKYKVILYMFKYVKGLLPVIFKNYFVTNDDCHSYPTRSGNHLRPLRCRKSAGQKSMKYNGAILWNSITDMIDHSIAGIINMQPTDDIFLRIMTLRDITVVKSLAKFIYGCFKQMKG